MVEKNLKRCYFLVIYNTWKIHRKILFFNIVKFRIKNLFAICTRRFLFCFKKYWETYRNHSMYQIDVGFSMTSQYSHWRIAYTQRVFNKKKTSIKTIINDYCTIPIILFVIWIILSHWNRLELWMLYWAYCKQINNRNKSFKKNITTLGCCPSSASDK